MPSLVEVVGRVEGFLLDFDGPVCDLFPPGSGSTIGDAAREPLRAAGVVLPEAIARTVEHLVVLRFAAERAPAVLEDVERAAIKGEVAAARTAPSDIEFGRRAGLAAIAYAKSPRHEAELRAAQPDAVIRLMTALADRL
ncbi:hypothetical protein AB0F43_26775 [Kribbella sp. NPDC023972]|uniref:hypothetical protein n=1 Tax=Kribbella sp. NPDC023972 TaxID=3154795 RepID=UPI0033E76EB6